MPASMLLQPLVCRCGCDLNFFLARVQAACVKGEQLRDYVTLSQSSDWVTICKISILYYKSALTPALDPPQTRDLPLRLVAPSHVLVTFRPALPAGPGARASAPW